MFGEDTLFEKQMQDFEAIEQSPDKNVDEQERSEVNEWIEDKPLDVLMSWVAVDTEEELRQRLQKEYQEDVEAAGVDFDEYFDKWYGEYEQGLSETGRTEYLIPRDDLESYLRSFLVESKASNKNQKSEKPKELKPKGGTDTGKLQKLEGKETNEQEEVSVEFMRDALRSLAETGDDDEIRNAWRILPADLKNPEKADEAKAKDQKTEKPKELKPKGGTDTKKLQKLERKVGENMGTVSNDPMLEKRIEELSQIEKDPNKNVDEALTSDEYTVTAQAFNRETGEEAGSSRDEVINIKTNRLFRDAASILDIKNAYESFWNDLNPRSKEIVFVSSIKSKTLESTALEQEYTHKASEEVEEKTTLQKASDKELADAMTTLSELQYLSSAISNAMDAIQGEISRRDREKEKD